jgi:hypothetical protein
MVTGTSRSKKMFCKNSTSPWEQTLISVYPHAHRLGTPHSWWHRIFRPCQASGTVFRCILWFVIFRQVVLRVSFNSRLLLRPKFYRLRKKIISAEFSFSSCFRKTPQKRLCLNIIFSLNNVVWVTIIWRYFSMQKRELVPKLYTLFKNECWQVFSLKNAIVLLLRQIFAFENKYTVWVFNCSDEFRYKKMNELNCSDRFSHLNNRVHLLRQVFALKNAWVQLLRQER